MKETSVNHPTEDHDKDQSRSRYLRFAAMIVTSSILMYAFTYLNTFAWNHIHFSEHRFYMTLTMTAMMTVVMLSFMLKMLNDKALNSAIYVGSAVLFGIALWLVRSQSTVQDVSYMSAMIPHHSIAILTSERAEISDPRVRKLANEIIATQRREISLMKNLIDDIERGVDGRGVAAHAQDHHQQHGQQHGQEEQADLPDQPTPPRRPSVPAADANAVQVLPGFRAEVVMTGLTYVTSIEFDDSGLMYVAEAGYSYGDDSVEPRILRVGSDGAVRTLVQGAALSGPINDLLWHDGLMYVSHRGRISALTNDGTLRDLVDGLPSAGDHHNNQLTVGPDGKIYFGQGTVTNAGVIGVDNFKMGWLQEHPDVYDIPARDISLLDRPFRSAHPWKNIDEPVTTVAFHPFGSSAHVSRSVRGQIKANGTILRMNADGSDLEVYASGLRNPYGLMWSPDGILYATENGFDIRGSRPIANDKEDVYVIEEGGWYGWPDYAMGLPITDPRFKPADHPQPQFLLDDHPEVVQPWLTFPKHSAIAKIDFSDGPTFGAGQMFIAFFGHMSPMTGKAPDQHGGHRVVRIDPATGATETFFAPQHGNHHDGGHHGGSSHGDEQAASAPADQGEHQSHSATSDGHQQRDGEQLDESVSAGPRRLLDVCFSPDGEALYIADFGAMIIKDGVVPVPHTGVIWRVVAQDVPADQLPTGLNAPQ